MRMLVYKISLLIFIFINLNGGSSSMSSSELPRLAGGVNMSPEEYGTNLNGALAVAVGIDKVNRTCNGVILNVSVASVYFPLNPSFDGQFLATTGNQQVDVTGSVFEFSIVSIPPGINAMGAVQYSRGSSPPPEGSVCVALGYFGSGAVDTARLNFLPATIANYSSCVDTFGVPDQSDGTRFCVYVPNPSNGQNAICSPRYRLSNDNNVQGMSRRSERWCESTCSVSGDMWPHCGDGDGDEASAPREQWVLGGVVVEPSSNCNDGTGPDLVAYLPNLTLL